MSQLLHTLHLSVAALGAAQLLAASVIAVNARTKAAVTIGATYIGGVVSGPKEPEAGDDRIPYPMGFYARGFDGRIDDPKADWKGRGLWSTSGDRTPWLMEGGKGSMPRAVHIQFRPDPLAR